MGSVSRKGSVRVPPDTSRGADGARGGRGLRRGLVACLVAGVAAGCSQDTLVAPKASHAPPFLAVAISCTADIVLRQTSCGQRATGIGQTPREAFLEAQRAQAARLSSGSDLRADVAIIGGQGVYVLINWTNSALSGSPWPVGCMSIVPRASPRCGKQAVLAASRA